MSDPLYFRGGVTQCQNGDRKSVPNSAASTDLHRVQIQKKGREEKEEKVTRMFENAGVIPRTKGAPESTVYVS